MRPVFSPGAPVPNAKVFAQSRFSDGSGLLLVHHGGIFYHYTASHWPEIEDPAIRADLYIFFQDAEFVDGEGKSHPFDPTRHKIADLMEALGAVTFLPSSVSAPCWLDGAGDVPAGDIVPCSNGLLHVPTRHLLPHTATFYVHHVVPFNYDPNAAIPARWIATLADFWPNDPESIGVLQEIFGYALSGSTALQKMVLIVGPKRSGKGTIARVLSALIGAHHVAGPTLASLGTNFGLAPLIGKPLAIISDARLRDNESIITERLLSISGEDTITIDRKYRESWTGKMPTRFIVMSNELPRLNDSAGALASRFIMLTMTRSFYGKENPSLTTELLEELPGIFNWALDGLERLQSRGHFTQPRSSRDALQELEDLGSPISAFVRDRCQVGSENTVETATLYAAWRDWCLEHGRDHPGTKEVFGRDLRAAVPGIRVTQSRDGATRYRAYEGLGLTGTTMGGHACQRGPETCSSCKRENIAIAGFDPNSTVDHELPLCPSCFDEARTRALL